IHGRALHHIIAEYGALGLGYAIGILEPIADALDFAHRRGTVHRDVKPHNILLSTGGRVVLTDFGIAQVRSRGRSHATEPGAIIGTPEYLSPEQAAGRPTSASSDLYSLGLVAYEIITGFVPFQGDLQQIIIAQIHTMPAPLTAIDSSLPPELDLVLARAL